MSCRTVRFASTISRVQNVSARLTSCVTASAGAAAVGFLPQQREAVQLLIDVEKRRRLVEEQHARLLREAGGEEHALAFAAAQRPERTPAELEALAAPHRLVRERRGPASDSNQPRGVRVAPHQHELLGAHRQIGAEALRQVRDERARVRRASTRRADDRRA